MPAKAMLLAVTSLGLVWVGTGSRAAEVAPAASKTKVERYERIDFALPIDRRYQNPFDADEVAVVIRVKTPGGQRLVVPAFFCQEYERRRIAKDGKPGDWIYPRGQAGWKARFAPAEVGTYEVGFEVKDRGAPLQSGSVRFSCVQSERKGFLQVSRRNPRFLEFSGGQPFFALGQNLAFIGPGQYVTLAKAEEIFGRFAANGGNFLRIWTGCEDWAIGIEARKSAWGRSWSWNPPFAAMPDGDRATARRCVELHGAAGTSLAVSPSHPLAVRPGTRYRLSGRIQGDGKARLRIEVPGMASGQDSPAAPGPAWREFQREFSTATDQYWLEPVVLRLQSAGTLLIDALSLREAVGGPELLWEADANRAVLGVYNPLDSFLLDQVIEAAERSGIYLQLCLFTRDLYMKSLGNQQSPEYAQAIRQAKKFLRYAIARWGYSTRVAAWEYFNEIDPGLPTDRFYTELGEYLEEIDVYHHLRTTSTWSPSPKDWRHAKLDIAEMHHYLRPSSGAEWKDEIAVLLERSRFLRENTPRGPMLLGEFGLADDRWGLSPYMKQDRELVHFHNALWASAMSGAAGTALFWWWEQLDQQDAYRHYQPLAAFLADLPCTAAVFGPISAKVSGGGVRAVALGGPQHARLWLFNPQAAWWHMVAEKTAPGETRGVSLEIPGLQPGRYQVRWWDTARGRIPSQETVDHHGPAMRLMVPTFVGDIACKVDPAG
jgi:hypothetical protein